MATKEKTKIPQRRKTAPTPPKTGEDVVYLPPKTFNRNRFLLNLSTVAAVVIAVILGVSVFFKVENVVVFGSKKYTAWDVKQASGIVDGENLLTFNRAKVSNRIMQNLPYVVEVHIGIKLPGTVNIEIKEAEVTYAVCDTEGGWWYVSSSGKIVEKAAEGMQEEHTKILGLVLENPKISEQAVAKELGDTRVDEDGNTVPITVTQTERLNAALNIAVQLEKVGIIGKAASIDVTDFGDIELWYGRQYQVLLGSNTQMERKISFLKGILDDPEYARQSGVLDITLTREPDSVIFGQ